MALKFRRGTTAQKSGSLAFGEPYVNTTIGALQIGLESSDITIRSVDSSSAVEITSVSASSFVSASSLKVTGNASIDGNLTLGGNITIGDQTTDTVTVTANLSSSLIPSATNTFDLGSSTRVWKDLYISTGSIKFVDGTSVVNTLSSNTLTTILQSTGSNDTKFSTLATYTGSIDTRFTQIGVVSGSLISSASANTIAITNINTFSGSQLTQNSSLATITGSLISTASNNVQRLTAMEAVSGSWITESETSSFARTNTSNTFVGNQSVTGDLTISGIITANEFHTAYVTSSVMYNSGSNRFGDSADDLQQLIGIVEITGSIKGNQFNSLATITGSLISSASSFETRNASLATITGSLITTASNNVVSITNLNTQTASLETRAASLATITGSLISSASSFETRNASLATISGSLISTASNHEQRIAANEAISSSYARINSANTFVGNQTITGSLITSGTLVEFNVKWPGTGSEQHIIKTDGFTLDGRTYEYAGFALTHYENSPGTLHNAMAMYMFDPTNTYGSEILTGPYRTHMQVYPSGSGGNLANVSVQDLTNGKTRALVYGDYVQIGAFAGQEIIIGNTGSIVEISGSIKTAQFNAIATITGSLISSASSFETRNASLATITGSLITTASNNVVSISNINTTTASLNTSVSNINTFSSSQLTQNSSLATITGSLIATASNNTISVANLNSYTSSLNNAIQLTGSTVSFLGNIVVYGTQSILYSENLQVNDNIIYLSPSGAADVDLGIVGHYNDGTYRHGGIFRDASDSGAWKVFKGLTPETSGTIDTSHPSFALADFKAAVFTGTSFNGTINADNGVVSGSSQVISILGSLNTYTGSNDTTNTTQNTRLTALEASASTALSTNNTQDVSISNLNTYTGSNDTTNTTQNNRLTALEASASTALSTNNTQDVSITNLNSTTASLNISVSNLNTYTGSFAAASVTLTNKTISGASNTLTNIGNSSLTNSSITIAGTATSLGGTISAATIGNAIGAFSGSSQIDVTATTNWASGIKTQLNTNTVVSGSSQIAFSGVTGTVSNAQLANSTISGISLGSNLATLTIGTGLSGTSYNGSGAVTIANTGVTSITGTANQVVASASTGGVTLSLPQSINSTATPTFGNLTINGTITASGDITAYYTSDKRHKNNIQIISNALDKVSKLNGVTWEWNDDVNEVTKSTPKTGLIAQDVQSVLPEVVTEREDGFLALDYSKMMGLMVEAIKEQQTQIHNLTLQIEELKKQKGL